MYWRSERPTYGGGYSSLASYSEDAVDTYDQDGDGDDGAASIQTFDGTNRRRRWAAGALVATLTLLIVVLVAIVARGAGHSSAVQHGDHGAGNGGAQTNSSAAPTTPWPTLTPMPTPSIIDSEGSLHGSGAGSSSGTGSATGSSASPPTVADSSDSSHASAGAPGSTLPTRDDVTRRPRPSAGSASGSASDHAGYLPTPTVGDGGSRGSSVHGGRDSDDVADSSTGSRDHGSRGGAGFGPTPTPIPTPQWNSAPPNPTAASHTGSSTGSRGSSGSASSLAGHGSSPLITPVRPPSSSSASGDAVVPVRSNDSTRSSGSNNSTPLDPELPEIELPTDELHVIVLPPLKVLWGAVVAQYRKGRDARSCDMISNELPLFGTLDVWDHKRVRCAPLRATDERFIRKINAAQGAAAFDELIRTALNASRSGDVATAIHRTNQAWLLEPQHPHVYWTFSIVLAQLHQSSSNGESDAQTQHRTTALQRLTANEPALPIQLAAYFAHEAIQQSSPSLDTWWSMSLDAGQIALMAAWELDGFDSLADAVSVALRRPALAQITTTVLARRAVELFTMVLAAPSGEAVDLVDQISASLWKTWALVWLQEWGAAQRALRIATRLTMHVDGGPAKWMTATLENLQEILRDNGY